MSSNIRELSKLLAADDDIPEIRDNDTTADVDISQQYDKAMQDLLRDMKLSSDEPEIDTAQYVVPTYSEDPLPQAYAQPQYQPPPPPPQKPQNPQYQQQQYAPYPQQYQQQQFYGGMEEPPLDDIADKLYLLESIEDYSRMLKKIDGASLSNIPVVNGDSSVDEVQRTYDILRQKIDRLRYTEIGEALMMSFTKVLEDTFDGKTEVLGSRINMRGVSSRVQYKMKYFKDDLARGARYICQNIPFSQPILEILPILIIHSRDASSTLKRDNISLDYERASNEMNNF